jgi:hypothetical protein
MHRTAGLVFVVLVLVGSAAYAGELQTGGLIQTQYVDEGGQDSQFLVKAARLKVEAAVTDRIKGKLQVDFARQPVVLDATLDVAVVDYANFSIGQFKIPFGYDFQLSRFYLETIERSLVMKKAFGNGVSSPYVRDVGAMLKGRVKIINYEVAVVNGAGYNYHNEVVIDDSTGIVPSTGIFPKWNVDNNNSKDVVGRIGIGVPMFAGLGFSMYEGTWACDQDRSAWGFYFHVDTGKVLFQYEYLRGKGYLGKNEWLADKYGGYYIVTGYRVIPFVQPTFKLDKFDPNRDEGGDNLTDYYYGLNLNYERNARLQVFYRDSKVDGDFKSKGWQAQVSALF